MGNVDNFLDFLFRFPWVSLNRIGIGYLLTTLQEDLDSSLD